MAGTGLDNTRSIGVEAHKGMDNIERKEHRHTGHRPISQTTTERNKEKPSSK